MFIIGHCVCGVHPPCCAFMLSQKRGGLPFPRGDISQLISSSSVSSRSDSVTETDDPEHQSQRLFLLERSDCSRIAEANKQY